MCSNRILGVSNFVLYNTSINGIFAALSAREGEPDQLMIDDTHLEAQHTTASLLKKGLFPDVSGARTAA